jgi:hypothetical protein
MITLLGAFRPSQVLFSDSSVAVCRHYLVQWMHRHRMAFKAETHALIQYPAN